MKKVYISYYRNGDYSYKDQIIELNKNFNNGLFEILNSKEDDIQIENLNVNNNDNIFIEKIHNKYLKDIDVLIVLVGNETKKRRMVDWEIRAAMTKTSLFAQSGIIIVYLPEVLEQFNNKIPRSILPNILLENFKNKKCYLVETDWYKLFQSGFSMEKYLNIAYGYGKMSTYKVDKKIKKTNDGNLF